MESSESWKGGEKEIWEEIKVCEAEGDEDEVVLEMLKGKKERWKWGYKKNWWIVKLEGVKVYWREILLKGEATNEEEIWKKKD